MTLSDIMPQRGLEKECLRKGVFAKTKPVFAR
jgi:hypothetical protein